MVQFAAALAGPATVMEAWLLPPSTRIPYLQTFRLEEVRRDWRKVRNNKTLKPHSQQNRTMLADTTTTKQL